MSCSGLRFLFLFWDPVNVAQLTDHRFPTAFSFRLGFWEISSIFLLPLISTGIISCRLSLVCNLPIHWYVALMWIYSLTLLAPATKSPCIEPSCFSILIFSSVFLSSFAISLLISFSTSSSFQHSWFSMSILLAPSACSISSHLMAFILRLFSWPTIIVSLLCGLRDAYRCCSAAVIQLTISFCFLLMLSVIFFRS